MSAPVPGNAVYLVAGPPAASRSAVARELAERLPSSVRVRADLHHRMLVPDGPPNPPHVPNARDNPPGPVDHAPEQPARRTRPAPRTPRMAHQLTATVVDGYFSAGFDVVTQGVVCGPDLAVLVRAIRSRPLHVLMLVPCPPAARTDGVPSADPSPSPGLPPAHRQVFDDPLGTGLWISTCARTPAETVDEILRRLAPA